MLRHLQILTSTNPLFTSVHAEPLVALSLPPAS